MYSTLSVNSWAICSARCICSSSSSECPCQNSLLSGEIYQVGSRSLFRVLSWLLFEPLCGMLHAVCDFPERLSKDLEGNQMKGNNISATRLKQLRSLKFPSSSFAIRLNLLHPSPSLFLCGLSLPVWCFSTLVNYYFEVSFNLCVHIIHVKMIQFTCKRKKWFNVKETILKWSEMGNKQTKLKRSIRKARLTFQARERRGSCSGSGMLQCVTNAVFTWSNATLVYDLHTWSTVVRWMHAYMKYSLSTQ